MTNNQSNTSHELHTLLINNKNEFLIVASHHKKEKLSQVLLIGKEESKFFSSICETLYSTSEKNHEFAITKAREISVFYDIEFDEWYDSFQEEQQRHKNTFTISTYNLYAKFGYNLAHSTISVLDDTEILTDEALNELDGGFKHFDLLDKNAEFCVTDEEEVQILFHDTEKETVLLKGVDSDNTFALTIEEFKIAIY